ncbi:MAG: zinc-dependent peptidase [Candidatus Bipolaricaulaceae bacterium]
MFGFGRWRRRRIRAQAFPEDWERLLKHNLRLYPYLPEADRRELRGHILVFLAEKKFAGGGGLQITDEMRVTIAGHACMLLLHRETEVYPALRSIIVYPHQYAAPRTERDALGVVTEGYQVRMGESWGRGVVVLAWDAVQATASDLHHCHNVAIHEFAHQLDVEDGRADRAPLLSDGTAYSGWARALSQDYSRLQQEAAWGRATLLDPYGGTSPAEFFAVVTECFFQRPHQLRAAYPALYGELRRFYRLDPADLLPPVG